MDRGLIVGLLRRLLSVESGGFIRDHLRDIVGLSSEISRIDSLSYVASVTAGGVITQPTTVRNMSEYAAEIYAIIGWEQTPGTDPGARTEIDFNIREQGRNFDLFNNNIRMASFVDTSGRGIIEWPRGGYVINAGADVQCRFTIPTVASYAAAASITKNYGVTVLLNLARKK